MSLGCGEKINLMIGSGVREYRPTACIGLISVLLMLHVDCCTMEGKEVGEDSYNSVELSEEEGHGSEKGDSEWKKVGKVDQGRERNRIRIRIAREEQIAEDGRIKQIIPRQDPLLWWGLGLREEVE